MKYTVRYLNQFDEDRWTVLPIKTKGRQRKEQIAKAMQRIFGTHITILEIAVARA